MEFKFVRRRSCPNCAATDIKVLYERDFGSKPISGFIQDYYGVDPGLLSDGRYQLVRCNDCDLVFQGFIGDDELLSELYGNWIETREDPMANPQYGYDIDHVPLSRDAHEIYSVAAHLGVRVEDMTTLDYGMGWALWARVAARLGCRSYGSDLSPSRMKYAQEHGVATLAPGDLQGMRFHFINTDQVFEHVAKPLELAEMLARALLPNGILKISVPSGARADAIVAKLRQDGYVPFRDDIMPVQPLEHINAYNDRSVQVLASKVGLKVRRPGIVDRYAFLRYPATISLAEWKKTCKELVRPFYQFRNETNLYRWLQKP